MLIYGRNHHNVVIIFQLKIKQKTLKKEEIIREVDKNTHAKMCIIASFVKAKFGSLNVKN